MIGKWFVAPTADGNGHIIGEITEVYGANGEYMLAKMKVASGPPVSMLLHFEYLAVEGCGIFESEEELTNWLTFSKDKPELKIVKLNNGGDK